MNYRHDYRAVGYPLRLYSGQDTLENLPAEMKRQRASRAFIVCGRSVARETTLIKRIQAILGEQCAGVFAAMGKDTPLPDVLAARDAAREARADLLIAVGAGSVIQGTRAVAVLLAEQGSPYELMTQYPEGRPAVSPKLLAPKLPIINVCTAATSAANRAGTAVKDDTLPHRMEFFDPKTRPVALFWDAEALMTAPPELAQSTAVSVFWRAVMNLGTGRMSPLVEADRLQAYRLTRHALHRVNASDPADAAAARMECCAAAFLQNRDADDGGSLNERHWAGRVVYALAAAIFNRHGHVSQGAANTALTPTMIRHFGARDPDAICRIGEALSAWHPHDRVEDAPRVVAAALEHLFRSVRMPVRIGELGLQEADLPPLLEHALKNFNADPQREFLGARDAIAAALRDAL